MTAHALARRRTPTTRTRSRAATCRPASRSSRSTARSSSAPRSKFRDAMRRVETPPRVLILRMRDVLAIDATGLRALEDLLDKARRDGTALVLSGVHAQPLVALERSGLLERIGADNAHGNIREALAARARTDGRRLTLIPRILAGFAGGPVDLRYSEADEKFRAELRAWLARGGAEARAAAAAPRLAGAPRVRHGLAAEALRRRLRRHQLAEGVRRPRRDAHRAARLLRGDRARRRALRRRELRRPPATAGPTVIAEGSSPSRRRAHAAHPARRGGLVPGLLGAVGGLRPRGARTTARARRRPLRGERPQDLDARSPRSRTTASCWCARTRARRSTAASPG